jgi:hypothetical protein
MWFPWPQSLRFCGTFPVDRRAPPTAGRLHAAPGLDCAPASWIPGLEAVAAVGVGTFVGTVVAPGAGAAVVGAMAREMPAAAEGPHDFDEARPRHAHLNCFHVGKTASLLSFPFEGTRSTVEWTKATPGFQAADDRYGQDQAQCAHIHTDRTGKSIPWPS